MIQRFIELGEGYSDLYELIELSTANQYRVSPAYAFHSVVKGRKTNICSGRNVTGL